MKPFDRAEAGEDEQDQYDALGGGKSRFGSGRRQPPAIWKEYRATIAAARISIETKPTPSRYSSQGPLAP
jgi:hypothetical protein